MHILNRSEKLKSILLEHSCLAVAFSGGVDSTFLLQAAFEILGPEKILALTVSSPVMAPDETDYAVEFCSRRNIPHKIVHADNMLQMDAFTCNPPDRCYHCKKSIFTLLLDAAADHFELSAGQEIPLADGTNHDDVKDYRPGTKALEELGIISPLRDAGFSKDDIRRALHERKIDIWDKPACACLASRIPYGQKVTDEKMKMIYAAESALHALGFSQVRVRCHEEPSFSPEGGNTPSANTTGRIEILPAERHLLYSDDMMDRIAQILKEAGFTYGSLDLGGYVMGNLNKF